MKKFSKDLAKAILLTLDSHRQYIGVIDFTSHETIVKSRQPVEKAKFEFDLLLNDFIDTCLIQDVDKLIEFVSKNKEQLSDSAAGHILVGIVSKKYD